MTDSRGYTARLIRANREADTASPGVMLGRVCIEQEIPVSDVAQFFGVSRMTIYKWFRGQENPRKRHVEKIEDVLHQFKNKVRLD